MLSDLEVIDDNKLEKIEDIVNFNSSQSPEPDHVCRNTYQSSKKFSKVGLLALSMHFWP